MREDNPWWLYVVALLLMLGLYAYYARADRYDECREKCGKRGFASWTYDPSRGMCSCGGATE